MSFFVVYELWTRARIIEAESTDQAYAVGATLCEADAVAETPPLTLSNWHVVPVEFGAKPPAPGLFDGDAVEDEIEAKLNPFPRRVPPR